MSTEKTFSSSRGEILTMALSFQFVLILIFYLCPCFAVEVSKACYGSGGRSCAFHNLKCSSGFITIQEAFYLNGTDCPIAGISNCDSVNVSSISLNGTKLNFTDTETMLLCTNCSTQSTCSLQASRRGITGAIRFSAVIYQCMNDSVSTDASTDNRNTEEKTGAIAGGVLGVFVVCSFVAAVLIWFKFVRNKMKDEKPEEGSDNSALAGSLSSTAIEHGVSRKTTSNYDYTTIRDGDNPVGRVQSHYFPTGKPSTDGGTTVLMEDDYSRINHNPPQYTLSPGYDTTASATAAVKELKKASSNSIDDDDYNHLGEGKPSVVSSDYDTTVSASKAVAQLGEMKDNEDDYDHFKRSEDSVIDSPYDTANHHSSVSADTAPNPYNLTK